MQLIAPPPVDSGLGDACGDEPGALCEAVWDATSNEWLAKTVDWVIGRPLKVIAILIVAWIVTRLARRVVRRAMHRFVLTHDESARALGRVGVSSAVLAVDDPRREARMSSITTVITSTSTVLIWVIATLLVVGELGIDLAPLIAATGIAGIALGFGAQNLVKDCVAGLFMLIEDQYGIGDSVDVGVATGSVERVTLRTTVLRGQDGTVWHVPNGEIRRVGNRSKLWSVAVLDVVVAYDADLEATRRVVQEVATRITESEGFAGVVLEAPNLLGVESVAADGVTLRLLVKTGPGEQFRLQRALREALKEGLDAAGIEVLPAPPREATSPPPSGGDRSPTVDDDPPR